jgi:hypothetical protein
MIFLKDAHEYARGHLKLQYKDIFLPGLQFFYLGLKNRDNLLPIADHTKAGFLENLCFRVAVNGDNILSSGTPSHVLAGAR